MRDELRLLAVSESIFYILRPAVLLSLPSLLRAFSISSSPFLPPFCFFLSLPAAFPSTRTPPAPPPPQLYSAGSEHRSQRVLASESPSGAIYSTPSQLRAGNVVSSRVGSRAAMPPPARGRARRDAP
jgi:hypothetical protein